MNGQRIVSLLPAATEMAFALGLGDAVVGVSHECDHPAAARSRPVVVRPTLDLQHMTLREIDTAVSARIGSGGTLYLIDDALLTELRPTLILTQDLCQVCAPSGNELQRVVRQLTPAPAVLWMKPHSLQDTFENLLDLGRLTARAAHAEALVVQLRARLERLVLASRALASRPRVFCLEWVDPLYCAGHWVPEMVELAGGHDAIGRRGADSVRVPWDDVLQWSPEVLIVAPCGFTLADAVRQLPTLERLPGWSTLPAVRDERVFCVDANAYFARPGPRVVDGVELLSHLLHPAQFAWHGPPDAYQRISRSSSLGSAPDAA